MGLTLIRNTKGKLAKDRPKIALVLAGGAITGGAFKLGGLKALNDFLVGRDIIDFDIYVGLSAGSLLSVPLAAGLSPDEMIRVLDGTSSKFSAVGPRQLYTPNVREIVGRPTTIARDIAAWFPSTVADTLLSLPELPGTLHDALGELLRSPDRAQLRRTLRRLRAGVAPRKALPSLSDAVPTGFFTNAPLEAWLRANLEGLGLPNDFPGFCDARGRELYIAACALDTAERAVFGPGRHDEHATISQAVQASTALPIFYQPARIDGVDYVDGGVRNTANIDVAIDRGADLVICYNPFRPIWNDVDLELPAELGGRRITDQGLKGVLNQVFRTLLQSRLRLGLEKYRHHPTFRGDIVVLEPKEYDLDYFGLNPMDFGKREVAMRHGFESVRHTIEQNFDSLEDLLHAHGLRMSQVTAAQRAAQIIRERGWNVAANLPPSRANERARARPRLRVGDAS